MNDLYNIVESIINNGSAETLNEVITKLNQNPGAQSKEYGIGENLFYVLKRFIGGALARDPKIKENSINAIKQINAQATNITTLTKQTFYQFFITATDFTDCKTKQQKNAYIQGKINIVRALTEIFKGSDKITTHFVQLIADNVHLQEELVEIIYELVGDKIKALKLTLSEEGNGKFLLNVLLKKIITVETINTILSNAIESYPKQSIALKHLGLNLTHSLPIPQQFFTSEYKHFTSTSDSQTEDGDLKRLYYLLQVQKYFLQNVIIAPDNIDKYLSTQMIVVWFEELRVKNKHMRKVAGEITIKFEESPQFAFEVLKFLHEKKVYLENVSQNHPFAEVYKNVDTVKFWAYLINLIGLEETEQKKDKIIEQEDQQKQIKKQEYLSELQYITRQKVNDLTPQQIGLSLTILIKSYQQSKKSQKLINLIWSLFHELLSVSANKKSKKKIVLNLRGSLILSKISLSSLQLESQIVEALNKVTKFLRLKLKALKQSKDQDKLIITFLNFVTGLVIYCIVYPQEVDVCGQIQFLYKDLQALVAKQKGVQVKRQGKKNNKDVQEVQDLKKPVHILVDVFISLLTKAPIFLRNSINLVFEQLVPFIDSSDLDTLLDVIQKPDQDYIEEI